MRAALLLLAGCASVPAAAAPLPPSRPAAPEVASTAPTWPLVTRSPSPLVHDGDEARVTRACGEGDAALLAVAHRIEGGVDPDAVTALLRSSGEPHVRPRVVTARTRDVDVLSKQLHALSPGAGKRRCGVSLEPAFVAVVVDALADLEPLPTRARTGEWLTFEATLHVPVSSAKLVVLGARGRPRTVPTTIDRGRVRARFVLDHPGGFTVQLVGTLAGGPRPMLEARVFADVVPADDDTQAPGENERGDSDAATLEKMIAALRTSEGNRPLVRTAALDALAQAHAEKMRDAGGIAHDVGDGDLVTRLEAAGLPARAVGENVARARSVPLAHRALHASPSHRLNLLSPEYTRLGLGTALDDHGLLYVAEVFASP